MSEFVDETYQRVAEIIKVNNLNVKSFEDKIEVSNNSIGTAIRRKASFKSNVLNKILLSFPEINPTWLLTGKGNMFLKGFGSKTGVNEPLHGYNISELNKHIKENLLDLLLHNEEIAELISKKVNKVEKSE